MKIGEKLGRRPTSEFKDSINLGLMPPLTGVAEIYGTEISNAAKIACDEINESGGVLGRPLKVVIEDDGSLPQSAVAAANKLLDQHQCVALIGNLLSNSRIAVAYQVAEPRRIPYLNYSFYEGSILSRYFFHFAALPNQQIDRMIPYMCKQHGLRMFFAGNNYEWPRGSIDAAKRSLEKIGGQVVGEEYYPIGASDEEIERLLDHVVEARPDVFVPYFAGTDQVHLLTHFAKRGLKDQMAVVMGHFDEAMASLLPPEVRQGFYSSSTYFMTLDTPGNKVYMNRLVNRPGVNGIWPLGNGILTNFGEGAYLCVKAFAKAANQAGNLETDSLLKALETISVSGPQGAVQMDATTHHAQINSYLSRCEADGSFSIVERFGAIQPVIPERYRHLRMTGQTGMEDIYLQSRMMAQMAEAVLLVQATDGTIVYTNPGAERMFGYSAADLNGTHFSVLFTPSKRSSEEIIAAIDEVLFRVGIWQGETEIISKDGGKIICSASVTVFTHPKYGEVRMILCQDITARKRAATALEQSVGELREAQRIAKLGSWYLDVNTNEVRWTEELYLMYGLDPSQPPPPYTEHMKLFTPESWQRLSAALTETRETCVPYELELDTIKKNGEHGSMWVRGECVRDAGGKTVGLRGVAKDITRRKKSEVLLRNLNRTLSVLSACNSAMVHADDEAKLLNEICRILVITGGYRMAWVGWAEHDQNRTVLPVAKFGFEEGYLAKAQITRNNTQYGHGPTGLAIGTGMTQINPSFSTNPETAPWREEALRRGYMSSIALPLSDESGVIGALTIYSPEANAFDADEVKLLEELAADIAYGIDKLRTRDKQLIAEAKFETAALYARSLIEASLDPLVTINPEGKITDVNEATAQATGLSRETLIGSDFCDYFTEPEKARAGYQAAFAKGMVTDYPLSLRNSSGKIRDVLYNAKVYRNEKGEIAGIFAAARDVTERKRATAALAESKNVLQSVIENAPIRIFWKDQELRYLGCNNLFARDAGLTKPEELIGKTDFEMGWKDQAELYRADDRAVIESGKAKLRFEEPQTTPTGDTIWLRTSKVPLTGPDKEAIGILGLYEDITDAKRAEQALLRANRALRTLSAGNLALMRAESETELLRAVTKAIVDQGGYCMAIVDYARQDSEKRLDPVAWAGLNEDKYWATNLTWADTKLGQLPAPKSIRTGSTQVCRDIANEPAFDPWRKTVLTQGFAANIAIPLSDGGKAFGALSIYSAETSAFDTDELRLLEEMASDLAYGINALRTRKAHDNHAAILRQSLEQFIQTIASTVEARDPYTAGHQRRVAELAEAMAQEMQLPAEQINGIHFGGIIHDLGKIQIPAEILAKPGKLSEIEFMLIKTHAQAGYEIVKDIKFPWPIAEMILQHHERLDGSGYPQGLKGDQIIPEAQIIAVADVVEAMATHRPYRAALGIEEALAEIAKHRGSHYAPKVVDACLKVFREGKFAFH